MDSHSLRSKIESLSVLGVVIEESKIIKISDGKTFREGLESLRNAGLTSH
jgi:hypothetical protein